MIIIHLLYYVKMLSQPMKIGVLELFDILEQISSRNTRS